MPAVHEAPGSAAARTFPEPGPSSYAGPADLLLCQRALPLPPSTLAAAEGDLQSAALAVRAPSLPLTSAGSSAWMRSNAAISACACSGTLPAPSANTTTCSQSMHVAVRSVADVQVLKGPTLAQETDRDAWAHD